MMYEGAIRNYWICLCNSIGRTSSPRLRRWGRRLIWRGFEKLWQSWALSSPRQWCLVEVEPCEQGQGLKLELQWQVWAASAQKRDTGTGLGWVETFGLPVLDPNTSTLFMEKVAAADQLFLYGSSEVSASREIFHSQRSASSPLNSFSASRKPKWTGSMRTAADIPVHAFVGSDSIILSSVWLFSTSDWLELHDIWV